MEKNSKTVLREDKKRATKRTAAKVENRSALEQTRLIVGAIVFLASLFLLVAAFAHLFCWRNDVSYVAQGAFSDTAKIDNICGPLGAVLADSLIGKAFGLFGLFVPLIGILLGLSLCLKSMKTPWHTSLSIMFLTICGSCTLAALPWGEGVYGSGLGGAFGIEIVELLDAKAGVMGVTMTLIVGWLLTGVVVVPNFIEILQRTTASGVEHGSSLWDTFKEFVSRKRDEYLARKEAEKLADDATPASDTIRTIGEEAPEVKEPAPLPFDVDDKQPTDDVEDVAVDDVKPTTNGEEPSQDAPKTSNIKVVPVFEHEDGKLSTAEIDKRRAYDPESTPDYVFPKVEYLKKHENGAEVSNEEIEQKKQRIEETLGNFGVPIESMTATVGPTVTLYEIVQQAGVKISRVQHLDKDIAQSLKAHGIRIIAPIPGKGTIGIEVPNTERETVSMRSAIQSERFQNFKAELPVVIGRTIQNENYVFDLAKMPHLLVAGATGQGKSVGLNAIIASLLYRKDPSQLKFVLIDPKTVEFSLYEELENHFLAKMESEDDAIVKDPKKALYTLNSLCIEMENRLAKCGKIGVRNIVEYNEEIRKHNVEGENEVMPYIVVVIDEYADLIMAAKEVERPVMRLAQKARAVGIHLIVATQRPDVKVITGTIKANFPARIAFRVMQGIDSRTILDQMGAQHLIGRGDMLMSVNGELTRIQCAFVDTPEVRDIVKHVAKQPMPFPTGTYLLPDYEDANATSGGEANFGSESGVPRQFDEYFAAVARDAVASGKLSTSSIQSVYGVGFNRAGRITRQLEKAGIVGPANGSKPRDARIHDLMELEALLQSLGVE